MNVFYAICSLIRYRDPVASFCFCFIEREVGLMDQFFSGIDMRLRDCGKTDTDRNPFRKGCECMMGDRTEDFCCDQQGIFSAGFRKQYDEFLSSPPCYSVDIPGAVFDDCRGFLQTYVAGAVTVCIVDFLKMIDIDHQAGCRRLVSDRSVEFFFDCTEKIPPVKEFR